MRGTFLAGCWLLLLEMGCGSSSPSADDSAGSAGAAAQAGSSSGGSSKAGAGAGGDASAGGVSATAGSGDAASSDAAGAGGGGAVSDCDCVGQPISWRYDGGRVAFVSESFITPCNQFKYERRPNGGEAPTRVCESTLGGCAGALGIGDVNAALSHADVQAALYNAPVLYGEDERPFDGKVRQLQVAGKVIDVGAACGQSATCQAIPDGVAALAELLWDIEQQQLAKVSCPAQ